MKKTKSGWAKATAGATASKEAMQNRIKVLDGYHTPRIAVEKLIAQEEFSKRVWEPANGFHRIKKEGCIQYLECVVDRIEIKC